MPDEGLAVAVRRVNDGNAELPEIEPQSRLARSIARRFQ
jgi:hypothetical protein